MNRLLERITFLALASLLGGTSLWAASTDRYWNNTGLLGDFNNGANWDIDSPPVAPFTGPLVNGDTAYINDGGTANISSNVTPVLQYLYLNNGTVQHTSGAMTINGSVRTIGAGGGTGTYLLDGSNLTMNGLEVGGGVYGDVTQFWGVGTGAGSTGTFTVNNYSNVTASGVARIGDTGGTGHLYVNSGSTFNQSGTIEVGEGAGANGTLTLTGSGTSMFLTRHASYGGNVWIGDEGGTGTLTIQDHAKFYGDTGTSVTYLVIGNVGPTTTGSTGHLIIDDASSTDSAQLSLGAKETLYVAWGGNVTGQTCAGDVTMTGYGRIVSQANTYVGVYSGSTAHWTMSGNTSASFTTASYFGHAGGVATINLSEYAQMTFAQDMQMGNSGVAGGNATMTLKDHALVSVSRVFVVGAAATGSGNNTTGNLILEGNSQFIMAGGDTWLGNYQDGKGNITLKDNAYFETTGASNYYGSGNRASTRIGGNTTATLPATPSSGNLNLEGGIFQTNYIMGTSAGTVNFKGGVLRASETTTTWLGTGVNYKVWAAGATLDTHSYVTTGDNIYGITTSDYGPVDVTVLGSLTEEATSTGGGLTVQGGGTLTLAGTNSYTGATTIATNGGTVVLASATALPAHTAGNSGNVALNSGTTLSVAAPNTTLGGQFSGTAGTISIDSTGAAMTGTSAFSGALVVNYGGSLNLSGTLPAATTVGTAGSSTNALLGGTGTLGNVTVLPNTDTTAGQSGGTKGGLEAGQLGAGTLHMTALNITGPAYLYVGNSLTNVTSYTGANVAFDASGTLTLNTTGSEKIHIVNSDLSAPGGIGQGTYHLIKHTGGILGTWSIADIKVDNVILSGRQTGTVTNNSGYLDFVIGGVLPVWTGKVGGTTTDNTWYASNSAKTNWQKTLTDTTPAYYVDTPIGDAVTFNDTGNGHLAVSIPANVSPTSVTVNSQYNYVFGNPGDLTGIIGTGLLVKSGSGKLTINTTNAYSGGTTIDNGIVQLGSTTALGAATGSVGFGVGAPATAILRLNGNTVTIGGLTTDLVTPGSPVVENGGSAATLTINNTVANTFAGVLQDGGGALGMIFGGSAKFTYAGVNTYSGDTTIGGTTVLTVGVANAIPHGTGKGNVVLDGGSLDLNGIDTTVNGLSGSSAGSTIANKLASSTHTLTVGDKNVSSSFSGYLLDTGTGATAGVLALSKIGSGTLTLSGLTDSTYSGGTALTQGTIKTTAESALGTGILTMSANTTLDLQDTIGLGIAALNVRGLSGPATATVTDSSPNSYPAVATLTLSPASTASTSFLGVIQDPTAGATNTLHLTMAGPGTQTLGPVNTYSGVTTLNGGTLVVSALANGGVASSIGKSSNANTNLLLNGGTFYYNGPSVSIDRGFTVNGVIFKTDNDITTSGIVTSTIARSAAAPNFQKYGVGTLTFSPAADSLMYFGDYTAAARGYVAVEEGKVVFNGGTAGHPVTYQAGQFDVNYNYSGTTPTSPGAAELNIHANTVVQCSTFNVAQNATGNATPGSAKLVIDGATITDTGNMLWGYGGTISSFSCTATVTNSTISSTGVLIWGGNGPGSTVATYNNSMLTSAGTSYIGVNRNTTNTTLPTTGSVTLSGTTTYTQTAGASPYFEVGGNGAAGTLNIYDTSSVAITYTAGTCYLGGNNTAWTYDGSATVNIQGTSTGTGLVGSGCGFSAAGSIYAAYLSGTAAITLKDSAYLTAGNQFVLGYLTSNASQLRNCVGTLNAPIDGSIVNNCSIRAKQPIIGMSAFPNATKSGIGTVTLTGTSQFITTSAGSAYIGYSTSAATASASGTVILQDQTSFTGSGAIYLGYLNAGATGQFTLNGSGTGAVLSTGTFQVGMNGGKGTVDVLGSTDTVTATNIYVGQKWRVAATDCLGTFNTSGIVNVSNIVVGADGNQGLSTTQRSTWNQNAGHTTASTSVYLGEWDQTDALAAKTAGYGVLNLTGGTFTAPYISTHAIRTTTGDAYGYVNFNGGILQASAIATDFIRVDDPTFGHMKLDILSGGAKFDTNSFDVTIALPLAGDLISTGGGLTKLGGSGTLTLTNALTYSGTTDIQVGTLQVYTPGNVALGALTGTGSLTVGDGVTANKLTLSGLASGSGAVLINATSELQLTAAGANTLGAVTGGGTLAVRNGVNLTTPSIHVDTLIIGGAPAAAAVPEPSTFALLALAGLAFVGAYLCRK